LPLSSVLGSRSLGSSLQGHGKNQEVEHSQFPPSVLDSCAFLHSCMFKTCGFCASHDLSRHERAEISTISAIEKTYARLSAMRRKFGPSDRSHIDSGSRYQAPFCGSPQPTFRRIRRSLKCCTIRTAINITR